MLFRKKEYRKRAVVIFIMSFLVFAFLFTYQENEVILARIGNFTLLMLIVGLSLMGIIFIFLFALVNRKGSKEAQKAAIDMVESSPFVQDATGGIVSVPSPYHSMFSSKTEIGDVAEMKFRVKGKVKEVGVVLVMHKGADKVWKEHSLLILNDDSND